MSEIINNSRQRVDQLKELILDLHKGNSVDETQKKLKEAMASVPYGEVVTAEEELIQEGLDREEVLKFCDLHTEALKGNIDTTHAKIAPEGHPVDTFINENNEIAKQTDKLKLLFKRVSLMKNDEDATDIFMEMHASFNLLTDIEKHYVRKENLVFPYLEKYEITGPPMVMWGKHDEIRSFMKSTLEIFNSTQKATSEELNGFIELMFQPTVNAISEMIYKEEKILLPMCMDTFTEIDWYQIYKQSDEIGYCLYDPQIEWKPEISEKVETEMKNDGKVRLSTGSFSIEELEALFQSLPVDLTYVDKDDRVKFFSHGEDRIFQRNRAILGRKVQYCHPPHSVHIVEKILDDFKSGKQDSAKFWINFNNMYVHIAYYAVRNEKDEYLGTLEVTQDIQQFRKIEGERRLLKYDDETAD